MKLYLKAGLAVAALAMTAEMLPVDPMYPNRDMADVAWEAGVEATTSFWGPTSLLPDSASAFGVEVGRHAMNNRLHYHRLSNSPRYAAWMVQITDNDLSFAGAVGPGASAIDAAQDSVLIGPNQVPDDGDEAEVKVFYVDPDATTGGENPSAVADSLDLYNTNSYFSVVLFRHGGNLSQHLIDNSVTYANVLIACQMVGDNTSGGINYRVGRMNFDSNSRNVVISYCRNRHGGLQTVNLADADNFLFTHNSFSHARGSGGGTGMAMNADSSSNRFVDNITSMYGHYSWPDDDVPIMSRLGSRGQNYEVLDAISWRDATFGAGRGSHRMTSQTKGRTGVYQCITYNWHQEALQISPHQTQHDVQGCYVKAGPAYGSHSAGDYPVIVDETSDVSGAPLGQAYLADIRFSETSTAFEVQNGDDLWLGSDRVAGCRQSGASNDYECASDGDEVDQDLRASSANPDLGPEDASLLDRGPLTDTKLDAMLDSIGASFGVDCDGSRYSLRDDFDADRITEFNNGTGEDDGINAGGSDNGGRSVSIPSAPAAGSQCTDTDGNGLTDAVESAYSISDPAGDDDGDGYTNIVEVAFWQNPTVTTAIDGSEGSTFVSGVDVYKYTSRDTTERIQDIDGDGAPDTLAPRIWPTGVPDSVRARHCMSGDSVSLLITQATPGSGTLLDSADVNDFITSTGDCGPVSEIRDPTFAPGAFLIPFVPLHATRPHEKPKPENPPKPERTYSLPLAA